MSLRVKGWRRMGGQVGVKRTAGWWCKFNLAKGLCYTDIQVSGYPSLQSSGRSPRRDAGRALECQTTCYFFLLLLCPLWVGRPWRHGRFTMTRWRWNYSELCPAIVPVIVQWFAPRSCLPPFPLIIPFLFSYPNSNWLFRVNGNRVQCLVKLYSSNNRYIHYY